MDQRASQKQPKVAKHVPRSHGNLPKLHFVHYSSRGSRFSKGFASNVLKGPNKDFSRAAFSYFSLPHPLWKHCLVEHEGRTAEFSMKQTNVFGSCLVRQINEAVRIEMSTADCVMNRKSEFCSIAQCHHR